MAGTETKRIIELTEASTVQSGDFIAVDSNARGTKKVSTDALATSAALTAETNARAGADEAEAQAREAADNALGGQVADLKSDLSTITGSESVVYQNGYFRLTNSATVDITDEGLIANASYATALIPCSVGNEFVVSGYCGNTVSIWAFLKSDGTIINKQTSNNLVQIDSLKLVAPNNSAYLLLNCYQYTTHEHRSYMGDTVSNRLADVEVVAEENGNSVNNIIAQLNSVNGSVFDADISDDNPTQTLTGKLIGIYGLIDIPSVPSYVVKEYDISSGGIAYIDAFADYDNCFYQALDSQGNILYTKTKANSMATIEEHKTYFAIPNEWKTIRVAQAGSNSAYFGAGLLEYTAPTILKWSGLKWAAMGDSLTEENDRTSKHYFDYISDVTGISVVNLGKSGTGYKRRDAQGEAFYQRVDTIPTDSDVVTIFGSGNDCSTSLNFGTYTDTSTSTVAGCVNTTISDIISRFLNADKLPIIGIIAPTPWMGNMPEDGSGQIMETYVNLLKQICEYRCIPFLDLYHDSCMFPNIAKYRTLAYSNDGGAGTHPDEAGHKVFAPRIKWFLESLLI